MESPSTLVSSIRDSFPEVYQWLNDRVRPAREQNNRASYRAKWWLFGEPRTGMRAALTGLSRYIATPETSKHRIFVFLDPNVIPDHTVFAIAIEDAFHLGILSSRTHAVWAAAAGSRMGVGNDLRWRNVTCFEPFPFPSCKAPLQETIRDIAEALDRHRKYGQSRYSALTLTDSYNVLEKLRSGEPLTAKENVIHQQGLVSVLKQLHDDLDDAVFDGYGWPHDLTAEEILDRLVALNAQRAEEERRGTTRWLRPEFQNPGGTTAVQQAVKGIDAVRAAGSAEKPIRPWPKELPAQVSAVREVVTGGPAGTWNAERTARAFKGAKRAQVEAVLESLSALGLLVAFGEAGERQWKAAV